MHCYDFPHPAVTADVVIFTIRDRKLKILLIRRAGDPYRGAWALPGGFVEPDEGLDQAAARELEEETGVTGVYLEQLYTFGEPKRDPRERVITVAYYALIPSERLRLKAADDAEAVGWFAMDDLPALAFDHADIVAMAHQRLVAKLDYSTIAFAFMPERFTLTELQEVYEIIRQETSRQAQLPEMGACAQGNPGNQGQAPRRDSPSRQALPAEAAGNGRHHQMTMILLRGGLP